MSKHSNGTATGVAALLMSPTSKRSKQRTKQRTKGKTSTLASSVSSLASHLPTGELRKHRSGGFHLRRPGQHRAGLLHRNKKHRLRNLPKVIEGVGTAIGIAMTSVEVMHRVRD